MDGLSLAAMPQVQVVLCPYNTLWIALEYDKIWGRMKVYVAGKFLFVGLLLVATSVYATELGGGDFDAPNSADLLSTDLLLSIGEQKSSEPNALEVSFVSSPFIHDYADVPEPAVTLLLSTGVVGLVGLMRRKSIK